MRVLDLDLDFFIDGAAHYKEPGGDRLDPEDYPPWSLEATMTFLVDRCKLGKKLPGFVVEHHADLFPRWRDAINVGKLQPPLEVTHVDAHADLGLGDAGYTYLLSELLLAPLEDRQFPKVGREDHGLEDGNWLSFAIACRWISDLTYVFNTEDDRPVDLMPILMEGFSRDAEHIQLAAVDKEAFRTLLSWHERPPDVLQLEPKVPFGWVSWKAFEAAEPFDVVCLARSPEFTPAGSDALFDEIRASFIDETSF